MENTNKKSKNKIIILSVFVAVLAVLTIVFCVLYAVTKSSYETSSINLENIYQRSFYDLVDNINNTETKLAKLVSSKNKKYTKKLLSEIYESANNAQNNLSYLPISMNGIPDTIKFVNQVGGYTLTLSKREDSQLNDEDRKTLNRLYVSIADIKFKLNEISRDIVDGYNISSKSKNAKEDYTEFTQLMRTTKTSTTDYPVMIYDGPFSDTVVNKEVKGLNFPELTEGEVREKALKLFKDSRISFAGEASGKFDTYDYNIKLPNKIEYYAQFTKKGGNLLTLSSYSDKDTVKYSLDQAIKVAENFAKGQGISNMKCVWSDVLDNDVYLNLAPVVNNVIYYPDLIKVKVDLASGEILGWEASTYYTNHVDRELPAVTFSSASAKKEIGEGYTIESVRLALSPLEYNREVLTHEIKCKNGESVYYFYINVQTGETENILKVIETSNGNLLM